MRFIPERLQLGASLQISTKAGEYGKEEANNDLQKSPVRTREELRSCPWHFDDHPPASRQPPTRQGWGPRPAPTGRPAETRASLHQGGRRRGGHSPRTDYTGAHKDREFRR